MAESRNILLISDLSSCDHYCYHTNGTKIRKKYTAWTSQLVESYAGGASAPDDRSLPAIALDGETIGSLDSFTLDPSLGGGFGQILISDQAVLIEVWADVTLYWQYDCATDSWNLVNQTINVLQVDELIPDPSGPGYVHTNIIGESQNILFSFETTIDDRWYCPDTDQYYAASDDVACNAACPSACVVSPTYDCTILNLVDGEGEIVSTFQPTEAECPLDTPTADDVFPVGECGWFNFAITGSCVNGPHKFSIVSTHPNLVVTTDEQGNARGLIKDINEAGPFDFTIATTCTDGQSVTGTVSVSWTPPTINPALLPQVISTIPSKPVSGLFSGITCDQGTISYHIVNTTSNGDLILNHDGSYIYKPDFGFVGQDVATIGVECCGCCGETLVKDIITDQTITTTITIDVYDAAIVNDAYQTCLNTLVATDPTANDSCTDPAGGVYTLQSAPFFGGSLDILGVPLNPGDTFNQGDILNFTPLTNFCGSDIYTYALDCAGMPAGSANVTINTICVNAIAINTATPDDTLVSGTVVTQPNCTYQIITPATNGTANIDPNLGLWDYLPNLGFEGIDTFEYEVNCGGCTDTAIITITVI